MYIQKRMPTSFSNYLKHVLQLLFVVFALTASVTRITDRRHHWWDVLAGAAMGATSAYLAVRCKLVTHFVLLRECSMACSFSCTY